MSHAPLPPSGAHRWVPCPGSIKAEAKYPEDESDSAKEGTAVHWVGASVLKSYLPNSSGTLFASGFLNSTAPNGIIITDEMIEAVDEYTRDVLAVVQRHGLLSNLHIENEITGGAIHEQNYGTPDCFAYDPKTYTLRIWDFKYGHRPVEVYNNWQLIDYVLIFLSSIDGVQDQNMRVNMRIVQPRCYKKSGPIDEYTCLASDLRAQGNQLRLSAAEALKNDPVINTGEHCRDCTARHACSGAQQAAQAGMEFNSIFPNCINELSPEAMGTELDMLERASDAIAFRLSGLQAQAFQQIKHGTDIPGRMIKMGLGRQKWNRPVNEVITLGNMFHIDLQAPQKAKTPKQAIKLGIDENVIKAYSETPKTGLKLIKDDGIFAKKVFSK